jgi:Tol biopolymer transport system component
MAVLGVIALAAVCAGAVAANGSRGASMQTGIFHGHGDVGTVLHKGALQYDAAKKAYTVSGSGENMWGAKDALHFAWKKVSGESSLAADIEFLTEGGDPHKKACLIIRQSLDEDSAYVDVAVHGDGLTSLQFRNAKGDRTHEVQSNVAGPKRVKLEKRGPYARMYVQGADGTLQFSGAATRIEFADPYYIGIGVCAHNKDAVEKTTFSNLDLQSPLPQLDVASKLYSTLETQTMSSTDRRVVHVMQGKLEAPNWMIDGQTLIYNSGGRIYLISSTGGKPKVIDTGFATRCNNDHGISPDGKTLVISDQSRGNGQSFIYMMPIWGGEPKQITQKSPSYWHGWSPDGKTLVYCAQRNGEFDVYSIPVDGGEEKRLTISKGLDDGPEYSPDGKYIYFNSDRTGQMKIYRMKPDGSDQELVIDDGYNNWFAHPSPDGKTLVFVSFERDVAGHPENKDVMLRQYNLATKQTTVLARLFGGQGTANVPCWSPDGKKIAFVTYQLIP